MENEIKWTGPIERKDLSYDPLWVAESKHWFAMIHHESWFGFSYMIFLNADRNKQITDSFSLRQNNKHILDDLGKTKAAIESIFGLLDRANAGETWIARIVMMGGVSEEDFQYYAVEGQPK